MIPAAAAFFLRKRSILSKAKFRADFTSGILDPRINFSRTSNATVTNSAGVITYAPHNLALASEQLDSASWNKGASTITANSTTAPNGTVTADTLTATAAYGNVASTTPVATIATVHTVSWYVKKNTYDRVELGIASTSAFSNGALVLFNLTTGVFLSSRVFGTGYSVASYSIQPDSNEFYRITATINTPVGSHAATIGLSVNAVAGSSIYAWGAQLEVGTSPTAYNATTVKNLLGYSELFDNAAWTKSNSFVQTNLLTYSEDFTVAGWAKTTITPVANSTTAPNGYVTADTLPAAGANSTALQTYTAANVVYTFSVWLKRKTGTGNIDITVDGTTYVTKTITTDWVRYDTTLTPAAGSKTAGIRIATNGDEVYAWGAQLVQGSTAGDYRRTDAAALPIYYANHNGVVCAEKLVENTATSSHYVDSAGVTTTANPYTLSIYAKAGENTFLGISETTVPNAFAYFNLGNGVLGTIGAAATAKITPENNGWYRCSITFSSTAGSNISRFFTVKQDNTASFAGNGTSGIYIFGAQLSDSASLDPYVLNAAAAPTAAAYYGARFDYDPVTLAPKGLLIEEQRSNLVLNSTIDGANLATQNVTVTAQAYTLSFYGTGQIVLSGTASATVTGTGVYPTRKTLTFTPTAGTLTLTVTGTVQYAQLEAGSFATSYIPTGASQVTRTADVATIQGSNFYSWWNQNASTFYFNAATNSILGNSPVVLGDPSGFQTLTSLTGSGFAYYNGSSNIFTSNTPTLSAFHKIAVGGDSTVRAVVANGQTVTTNSSPFLTSLLFGVKLGATAAGGSNNINGYIKQISYYNTRLSDATLKGLTA